MNLFKLLLITILFSNIICIDRCILSKISQNFYMFKFNSTMECYKGQQSITCLKTFKYKNVTDIKWQNQKFADDYCNISILNYDSAQITCKCPPTDVDLWINAELYIPDALKTVNVSRPSGTSTSTPKPKMEKKEIIIIASFSAALFLIVSVCICVCCCRCYYHRQYYSSY